MDRKLKSVPLGLAGVFLATLLQGCLTLGPFEKDQGGPAEGEDWRETEKSIPGRVTKVLDKTGQKVEKAFKDLKREYWDSEPGGPS